jgi:hypothetical protein
LLLVDQDSNFLDNMDSQHLFLPPPIKVVMDCLSQRKQVSHGQDLEYLAPELSVEYRSQEVMKKSKDLVGISSDILFHLFYRWNLLSAWKPCILHRP